MQTTEKTKVFIRSGPMGRLPAYATIGSAGCDLYASIAMTLRPGETIVLPLDLVMAIEPGIEAQIRPRSGLSLQTALRLPNTPGTIDSDYRSGVGVILQNSFGTADLADRIIARPELAMELAKNYRRTTLACFLDESGETAAARALTDDLPDLAARTVYLDEAGNPYGTIYIKAGDRIAQMVFARCLQADFAEHPNPEAIGFDRGGGFGSTGLNR